MNKNYSSRSVMSKMLSQQPIIVLDKKYSIADSINNAYQPQVTQIPRSRSQNLNPTESNRMPEEPCKLPASVYMRRFKYQRSRYQGEVNPVNNTIWMKPCDTKTEQTAREQHVQYFKPYQDNFLLPKPEPRLKKLKLPGIKTAGVRTLLPDRHEWFSKLKNDTRNLGRLVSYSEYLKQRAQ